MFYSAAGESGMFRLDWTLSRAHEQAPTLRYGLGAAVTGTNPTPGLVLFAFIILWQDPD